MATLEELKGELRWVESELVEVNKAYSPFRDDGSWDQIKDNIFGVMAKLKFAEMKIPVLEKLVAANKAVANHDALTDAQRDIWSKEVSRYSQGLKLAQLEADSLKKNLEKELPPVAKLIEQYEALDSAFDTASQDEDRNGPNDDIRGPANKKLQNILEDIIAIEKQLAIHPEMTDKRSWERRLASDEGMLREMNEATMAQVTAPSTKQPTVQQQREVLRLKYNAHVDSYNVAKDSKDFEEMVVQTDKILSTIEEEKGFLENLSASDKKTVNASKIGSGLLQAQREALSELKNIKEQYRDYIQSRTIVPDDDQRLEDIYPEPLSKEEALENLDRDVTDLRKTLEEKNEPHFSRLQKEYEFLERFQRQYGRNNESVSNRMRSLLQDEGQANAEDFSNFESRVESLEQRASVGLRRTAIKSAVSTVASLLRPKKEKDGAANEVEVEEQPKRSNRSFAEMLRRINTSSVQSRGGRDGEGSVPSTPTSTTSTEVSSEDLEKKLEKVATKRIPDELRKKNGEFTLKGLANEYKQIEDQSRDGSLEPAPDPTTKLEILETASDRSGDDISTSNQSNDPNSKLSSLDAEFQLVPRGILNLQRRKAFLDVAEDRKILGANDESEQIVELEGSDNLGDFLEEAHKKLQERLIRKGYLGGINSFYDDKKKLQVYEPQAGAFAEVRSDVKKINKSNGWAQKKAEEEINALHAELKNALDGENNSEERNKIQSEMLERMEQVHKVRDRKYEQNAMRVKKLNEINSKSIGKTVGGVALNRREAYLRSRQNSLEGKQLDSERKQAIQEINANTKETKQNLKKAKKDAKGETRTERFNYRVAKAGRVVFKNRAVYSVLNALGRNSNINRQAIREFQKSLKAAKSEKRSEIRKAAFKTFTNSFRSNPKIDESRNENIKYTDQTINESKHQISKLKKGGELGLVGKIREQQDKLGELAPHAGKVEKLKTEYKGKQLNAAERMLKRAPWSNSEYKEQRAEYERENAKLKKGQWEVGSVGNVEGNRQSGQLGKEIADLAERHPKLTDAEIAWMASVKAGSPSKDILPTENAIKLLAKELSVSSSRGGLLSKSMYLPPNNPESSKLWRVAVENSMAVDGYVPTKQDIVHVNGVMRDPTRAALEAPGGHNPTTIYVPNTKAHEEAWMHAELLQMDVKGFRPSDKQITNLCNEYIKDQGDKLPEVERAGRKFKLFHLGAEFETAKDGIDLKKGDHVFYVSPRGDAYAYQPPSKENQSGGKAKGTVIVVENWLQNKAGVSLKRGELQNDVKIETEAHRQKQEKQNTQSQKPKKSASL